MMSISAGYQSRQERSVTRATHRLYWKAFWQDPVGLLVCIFTRFPAVFLYEVLIPIQIALGLEAIFQKDFDAVGSHVFVIMALAVGFGVLWSIGGVAVCRNGIVAAAYVQRRVFANYLKKDYDFYANTFLGSLGAQATRLRETFNEYSQILLLAVPRQFIVVVAGIIVIAIASPVLALVTLVGMSAVLSFTIATSKWRLKYRRLVSEASSDLSGAVGDALGHGDVVKSFANEEHEQKNLEGLLGRWGKLQYKSWAVSIPTDAGRVLLAAATIGVLLVATAKMYQAGSISLAIVVLVQIYVIKMISATHSIAEIIKDYESTMGSAYQPIKTMLLESNVNDMPGPKPLPKKSKDLRVVFDQVGYGYPGAGGVWAVKGLDLVIEAGKKVGLVGYSGSGKTTLTKLLLRFMDVTKGTVSLGGIDLRECAQSDLRRQIAYVPQEPLLFHRTIAENIHYGRPEAKLEQVLRAGRLARLDEFVKDLPGGYDTLVGERGIKLSGGQRQRVAIARALLKDAPILVLDEATSALDSRSEKFIQAALWKLMEGRTALVIAHRLSTIHRMDRIAVMDKGKIVQLGTHQELLKDKKGIYARLWKHQSGGYVGLPQKDDTNGGIS